LESLARATSYRKVFRHMPWQNQSGGGGPWGGGGGGGGGGGPWGRGPSGQRPPDLEELLRRSQDRMKSYIPGGFGSSRGSPLSSFWCSPAGCSPAYTVQPTNWAFRSSSARRSQISRSGVPLEFPAPIGHVEAQGAGHQSARNRRAIGQRRTRGGSSLQAESLMLTGDENIIDIRFNVQWQISDPNKFLFEIDEPDATIKNAAEAAMREVIGQTQLEHALSGPGRRS
jgi:membrane protease subunit HflK